MAAVVDDSYLRATVKVVLDSASNGCFALVFGTIKNPPSFYLFDKDPGHSVKTLVHHEIQLKSRYVKLPADATELELEFQLHDNVDKSELASGTLIIPAHHYSPMKIGHVSVSVEWRNIRANDDDSEE